MPRFTNHAHEYLRGDICPTWNATWRNETTAPGPWTRFLWRFLAGSTVLVARRLLRKIVALYARSCLRNQARVFSALLATEAVPLPTVTPRGRPPRAVRATIICPNQLPRPRLRSWHRAGSG